MKLLNRGFISVKPTEEFSKWKIKNSDDEIIESINAEATIYLIEEDFWDDADMINKYFKKIANQEFTNVTPNLENWPKMDNPEDFHLFFDAELGSFVFDLLKTQIESETIKS
jgi:hypothetical protein